MILDLRIMNLGDLKNKKICILGFGIENRALVDFLIKKKIDCEITICDASSKKDLGAKLKAKNIKWRVGKNYDKNLDQYDIVFRIAGYPLFSKEILKAEKKGIVISSATKLFFDLCPSKNIIGITGTKGKGTTSSLIAHIIKNAGKRVWFGGNIGVPMFSFLEKINKNDFVVLELSSFQLEDLEDSPHIAVITNFTPEHLAPADPKNPNYHQSLKKYLKAKENIFKWQKKGDYLVLGYDFQFSILNFQNFCGKIKHVEKSELESKLVGEYNKENIGAAVQVARILKINKDIVAKAVKSFEGLPHRIEFVRNFRGVKYFDNSFATTPEATIKDIESFKEPMILILGGSDKASDFSQLAQKVKASTKHVVLLDVILGTKRIKKELEKYKYPKEKISRAKSMKKAVASAKKQAEPGDIVLLSTACASFGIFKNYKDRGDQFKLEVKNLK